MRQCNLGEVLDGEFFTHPSGAFRKLEDLQEISTGSPKGNCIQLSGAQRGIIFFGAGNCPVTVVDREEIFRTVSV